jgi:hypothetical protein
VANKIYVAPETAITFLASGGTVAFTPTSLADQAGRVSARHDRGAGSRAGWYEWRAWCKAAATPTVGRAVVVSLATSDGTIVDGNLGTADAAVSSGSALALNKLRNLRRLGSMVADGDAGNLLYNSGTVFVPSRYISVYWFDDLGQALTGTVVDHGFSLTPIPDEVQ